MPNALGEGMTGSRVTGLADTSHINLEKHTPQPHIVICLLPASLFRPGPTSRPHVLAALRALRLDPSPCLVLPKTVRRQQKRA